MTLSHEDVQEIVQLLDELDATELHLRTRHFALSLRRDQPGHGWSQALAVRPAAPTPVDAADVESTSEPPPAESSPVEPPPAEPESGEVDGLVAVRTPLTGTFYRAPRPGAPPYVEVGTRVQEDTVVAIMETMKLMSSVHAGASGRVAQICVDNAQTAAGGAVLMRIAPEPPEVR